MTRHWTTMLKQVLPQPIFKILRGMLGRYNLRRWKKSETRALELTGGVVLGGPFVGMQYVPQTGGSALAPKLLGTYEMELHTIVERIIQEPYDLVINIGAAEGYYAVGLLWRMAKVRVTAFEMASRSRRLLEQLALHNEVADRLSVLDQCTAEKLDQALIGARRALVICDIEGAEATVLDPIKVVSLSGCDLLVELHESDVPGVSACLDQRFESTHHIEVIDTRRRTSADVPDQVAMSKRRVLPLLSERRRTAMQWYWMTPRR